MFSARNKLEDTKEDPQNDNGSQVHPPLPVNGEALVLSNVLDQLNLIGEASSHKTDSPHDEVRPNDAGEHNDDVVVVLVGQVANDDKEHQHNDDEEGKAGHTDDLVDGKGQKVSQNGSNNACSNILHFDEAETDEDSYNDC